MRESMGAAWVFSICLTFIILFTAYLAISVNYARAFRVKSHLVSIIEENEGYASNLDETIDNYLYYQGYDASGTCENSMPNQNGREDWQLVSCAGPTTSGTCNACIYRALGSDSDGVNAERANYKVVVFFKFDLPVISYFTTFKVSGESRYIYDFANE